MYRSMIQIVNMMVKWKTLKDLPFGVFCEKAVVYLYPNPIFINNSITLY